MERWKRRVTPLAIGLCALLAAGAAYAGGQNGPYRGGRRYKVTVTNLTRGQVITPPVAIVHDDAYRLFDLGSAAIPELAALAEDGNAAPLRGLLETDPSVLGTEMASGPVMPGATATIEVTVQGPYRFVTVAGMLASSNDAFFAVRGENVPLAGVRTIMAEAYDAGSEANLELCRDIPGPPCGNGGVRNPDGAEGYVHVHAGIHGIGDLVPAQHDWRNPVAEVRIEPVR
jgi:hypothetical protein